MSYDLIVALAAFAFAASITPGPNNLMVMTSGVNYGFRRSMPHILGVVIGFAVMQLLAGAGLMRLFSTYPLSYVIFKSVSIAYLLFLAWKVATAHPLRDDGDDQAGGKPFSFLQAALFQWVNPKGWAVSLTAFSAYTLSPHLHPMRNVFIVALVFALVNTPCQCIWTLAGTQLRRFLTDPVKLRVFNVAAAVLLIGSLYPILFAP